MTILARRVFSDRHRALPPLIQIKPASAAGWLAEAFRWAKLRRSRFRASQRGSTTMLPMFRNGDRVTVDVGLPDPQRGEIVAVSDEGLTCRSFGNAATNTSC